MDSITINLDNVTHIDLYILTLTSSFFSKHFQSQWLRNQQCLREALDQFLDPGNPFPRETVIDYFDRSLYVIGNEHPTYYRAVA